MMRGARVANADVGQPREPFPDRWRRAGSTLRGLGALALIASDVATVRWLTGRESEIEWGPPYPLSAGTLVVLRPDGIGWILCPAGEEVAGPAIRGVTVDPYEGYSLGPLQAHENCHRVLGRRVSEALPEPGGTKLGDPRVAIEAHALPMALAPRVAWVDASEALQALRITKDPSEIELLERSARVASAGQRAFRSSAAPGIPEVELFSIIHTAMEMEAGARVPVFADLVSGPRLPLVGAPPTQRRIGAGELVLCDLAPRVGGYWSDSCTTVCVGRPTPEMVRLHDACRQALDLGVSLARPGVLAGDIDARLRGTLRSAGYEYPHHSGHGIGTNFHEAPRIVPGSTVPLEAGMVLALEPAGFGNGIGCRLELLMEVMPAGGRVLTEYEVGLECH